MAEGSKRVRIVGNEIGGPDAADVTRNRGKELIILDARTRSNLSDCAKLECEPLNFEC
jgi:hypothetical protein